MKWEGNEQNKTKTKKYYPELVKERKPGIRNAQIPMEMCRNRSERDFTSTI